VLDWVSCSKPAWRAGGSGRRWIIDYRELAWRPYACAERFITTEVCPRHEAASATKRSHRTVRADRRRHSRAATDRRAAHLDPNMQTHVCTWIRVHATCNAHTLLYTQEASRCLSNQTVLFSGDSHMRTFFNSLVKHACGVPGIVSSDCYASPCCIQKVSLISCWARCCAKGPSPVAVSRRRRSG
jgi:hypothetical protein